VTSPQNPRKPDPVAYKGEALDAARGPGLGCFWIQMIVLVGLIILTPVTVSLGASPILSGILLFLVILLLLLTGQTMIFLLRLVAAGRSEGRRRPLASATPTVGEIEDEAPTKPAPADAAPDALSSADSATPAPAAVADGTPGNDASGVRQ
jgi:hypothetical protein